MSDNMDAMLALHAGADYAKPRILTVDRIDFGDHESIDTLIPELMAFREKNSDPSVTISGDKSETDDRLTGYIARRSETEQETSTRIDGYRRFVGDLGRRHRKSRLEAYEQGKKEFGA